jgi:hypothetical protein
MFESHVGAGASTRWSVQLDRPHQKRVGDVLAAYTDTSSQPVASPSPPHAQLI